MEEKPEQEKKKVAWRSLTRACPVETISVYGSVLILVRTSFASLTFLFETWV